MESPPWAYATFLFPGHWKKRGGESQSQSLKRTKPCFAGLHAFCSPIFPQNEAQEDAFTIRIRKHCFRFANQNTHRSVNELRSVPPIFNPSSINHCSCPGKELDQAKAFSEVAVERDGWLRKAPACTADAAAGVVAKRDHYLIDQ